MKTIKRIFVFAFFLLAAVLLFACGEKGLSIKFDYGYAVEGSKNNQIVIKVEKDASLSEEDLANLPTPEKDGRVFINWKLEEGNASLVGSHFTVDKLKELTFTEDTKFAPTFREIQTAAAIVENVKEEMFEFSPMESFDLFKTSVILPTTVDGVRINWSLSSTENLKIQQNAEDNTKMELIVKTAPTTLTNVTLKASVIDESGKSAVKEFVIKVVPAQNEALLAAFVAKYEEEIANPSFVLKASTYDFVKKFTHDGKEYNVSWDVYTGEDMINVQTGVITKRPFKGNEETPLFDAGVTFAFSGNNSEGTQGRFNFKVQRTLPTITEDINYIMDSVVDIEKFPVSTFTKLEDGKLKLNAMSFEVEIANRTTMSLQGKQEDITLTWVSSLPSTIDNNGKVDVPFDGDKEVTLTVSISYGGMDFERTISFIIPKFEALTIAQAIELAKGTKNVAVRGILTGLGTNGTYHLQDANNAMAIYMNANGGLDEFVGKEIVAIGERDIYNGLQQIKSVIPSTVIVLNETPTLPIPVNLDDEATLTNDDLLKHQSKLVSLSNVTLLNVDKASNGNVSATLNRADGQTLFFYYDSRVKDFLTAEQLAEIDKFANGYIVTISNVILGWKTNAQITPNKGMTIAVSEPALSDEESVAAAKTEVQNKVAAKYDFRDKLDLITVHMGADIAWTSTNEEAINPTTGVVTPGAAEVTVTLTATITKGIVMDSWSIEVTVAKDLPAEQKTIANAHATVKGQKVVVIGILTTLGTNNTYYLQDGTHGLAVYGSGNGTLEEFKGKRIEIVGEKDEYNSLRQIKNINLAAIHVIDTPTFPEATDISAFADFKASTLLPHQGRLVTIKDAIISGFTKETNGNVLFKLSVGTNEINFKYDSRIKNYLGSDFLTDLETLKDGDKVTLTNLVLGWSNNPQLQPGSQAILSVAAPMSDQERVDAAYDQVATKVADTYEHRGEVLDLITSFLETTIVWTSTDEVVINPTTGAVTLPEATATEDATVTLTAVVTKSEVSRTFTKIVTVKKEKTADQKTVALALAAENNIKVTVIGILTSLGSNQAVFLQDENDAIAINVKKNTDLDAFIGKKVELIGYRGTYKGLNQITGIKTDLILVLEETPALPAALDLGTLADLSDATLLPHQGKLVDLTDFTVSNFGQDTYKTYVFDLTNSDGKTIKFKFDNRTFAYEGFATVLEIVKALENGKVLTIKNAHLSWYETSDYPTAAFIHVGVNTTITVAE